MPLEEQLEIIKNEFYDENAAAKDKEEKKV